MQINGFAFRDAPVRVAPALIVVTMKSGWRAFNKKRKIQTRHCWDMSLQSSLRSCPPNEERSQQDVAPLRRHKFSAGNNSSSSKTSSSRDDSSDMSIRRCYQHGNEGRVRYSKKNFRMIRPERLDMSTVLQDANSSMISQVPVAPRHASDPSLTRFFPSPTSVMERRTSTGSFF